MNKTIKQIFQTSEKAELLEAIGEELVGAVRVVVCFESRNGDTAQFQYHQLGFNQTYEVIGFLDLIAAMVEGANKDSV